MEIFFRTYTNVNLMSYKKFKETLQGYMKVLKRKLLKAFYDSDNEIFMFLSNLQMSQQNTMKI